MTEPDAREARLARWLVGLATAWFSLVSCWELFGPVLAGHTASSASVGIIAENLHRWGIWGPVWEYTRERPPPSAYYCHHPWGIFWTTGVFFWLFGHHDFVCRLAPVLLSAVTPSLVFLTARELTRPLAAAMGAVAFSVLPIALSFSNFNALEVPVIAYTLLSAWGLLRFRRTWARRDAALTLVGAALALHADWPAVVFVSALLGVLFARGWVAPRWFSGAIHYRALGGLWAGLVLVTAATLAFYAAAFHSAGKLGDLFAAYGLRKGASAPLTEVLASRRYWLELAFTPIGLAVAVLAVPLALGRAARRRSERELVPLAFFAMASVQYVVFRQGADIHFFWPHYFAAWIALGVALGVDSASGAFESRLGGRALALAAAVAGLALALVARDGVAALAYARRTGGRFDEKGVLIDSDGLETAVLRALQRELPADTPVELHEGMHATWAQVWALGGRVVGLGRPVPRGPAAAAYVADARTLPDEQLAELVRRFRVRAYGPVLVADLAGSAGVSAFRVREREPSWLEWAFVSATEPVRSFESNALLTWEARVHLSAADELPSRELVAAADLTDEAVLRVAHNALVQEGRDAEAHDAEARLVERYARATARFDDGTELLGARFDDGARPALRLLFRAAPAPRDVTLRVRSRVLGRAFLSVTMPDPGVREVGPAPYPPTRRWRAGFLYEHAIPIVQRPGREVFELEVVPRGARAPMGYTGSLPAGASRGAAKVLELP